MSTNPLLKIIRSTQQEDDNDYINPYDDGSMWSLPNTTEYDTSNPLSYYGTEGSMYNALNSYSDTIPQDPLQAPRNQVQYYTNKLGEMGVEPEKPKFNVGSFFSNALTRVFALPTVIDNTLAGGLKGIIETKDVEGTLNKDLLKQTEEAVKNGTTIKKMSIKEISDKYKEIENPLSQAVKSGAYTTGSLINPELRDKATDYGDALLVSRNSENAKQLSTVFESPGYLGAKAFGANEETALGVGNAVGDFLISVLASKHVDVDGVGKALKYINKADDVDDIAKVANNMDEALEFAKKSMSKDDYIKQLEKTANLTGKKLEDLDIDKYYNNYLNTYANNLMQKTDKYLGGLGDFKGVTIGHGKYEKTLLSKETLKSISEDKLKKALVETGLSLYSPIGALTKGSIPTKISDMIGETQVGKAVKSQFEDAFAFGKNNQWAKGARQAYEEGRIDDVLKNVNRKGETAIQQNIRKANELWHINFSKKMKNMINEESASKITTAMEGRTETYKDFVEETVVNDEYVNAIRNKAESKLDELSKSILEDFNGNKVSDLSELRKIQDELKNLNTAIGTSTLKYTDVLKELGVEDLEPEFFTKSLTDSVDSLTEELTAKGYANAREIAMGLKTATNNILDTIEESAPTLAGRFKGAKVFDFTEEVNDAVSKSANFEVKNVDDIKKQIRELKAKNKTYFETEGKDSEIFTNKIKKLEIELEEQKAYAKLNPKVEAPTTVKPEEIEYETYMPGWSEKLDEFEPKGLTGQEETVIKDKSNLMGYKNKTTSKVIKSDDANVEVVRTSVQRDILKDKIKNSNLQYTDKQMEALDLLSDEQIKNVSRTIDNREKLYKESKYFFENNSRVSKKMKQFFKDNDLQEPRDVEEMLVMLSEYRQKGIDVPSLNFKTKKDELPEGKLKKLGNATISKKFEKPTEKQLSSAINTIKRESGVAEKISSYNNFIMKTIENAELDYDTPLGAYYGGMFKYFEMEGIEIPRDLKKAVVESTSNTSALKEYIKDKLEEDIVNLTSNMSKSELDLYMSLYNHNKMPNISTMIEDSKASMDNLGKYLKAEELQGSKGIKLDDVLDDGEDIDLKREAWLNKDYLNDNEKLLEEKNILQERQIELKKVFENKDGQYKPLEVLNAKNEYEEVVKKIKEIDSLENGYDDYFDAYNPIKQTKEYEEISINEKDYDELLKNKEEVTDNVIDFNAKKEQMTAEEKLEKTLNEEKYKDIVFKPTVEQEVAVDSVEDISKKVEPEVSKTTQSEVSVDKIDDEENLTPLEKLAKQQEPMVKEKEIEIKNPKTEDLSKLIDEEKAKKLDGKFIGYEFEVNGSKVVLDENLSEKDISKIFTEDMIAKNYVYTDKLPVKGRAINGDTVMMNLKNTNPELIKTIRMHEDTHIIQQVLNDPMIGGEELRKFMGTLPEAEQGKVAKLLTALNLSGQMNTSEAHIRAKQLTGYISSLSAKKAPASLLTAETDAIVGSLILNPNTEVAELAKDVFGEDIAYKYIEARMKNFSSDIPFDSDLIRTKVQDEMQGKIYNLKQAYNLANGDKKQFYDIKKMLDSVDNTVDSYDNASNLLEKLEKYKDIDPEGFEEAVKGIDKHIKVYSEVEKVVKIDLTKDLTKEEFEIYESVSNYFKEFGIEEGIIKPGEEDLWSNYVFHSLNPQFKMDKEAQRIAKEKWGSSFGEIFNANQIERRYKGTIEEINTSFRKTLEEKGVTPVDLFETNITDIYLKRALGHEDTMLKMKNQNRFIEDFGMEYTTNWSKQADTAENVINTIEKYIPDSVKEDTEVYSALLKQIKEDYSKSNKTAYKFLKENGDKYGAVGMYDYLLKDVTAEEHAKRAINTRFRTEKEFSIIDYDPVNYDAQSKRLVMDSEEQIQKVYEEKLEAIELLKVKGMSDRAYTDHRKLAEEQGKQFVDNGMIRIEANEIVQKEEMANKMVLTQDELKEWRTKRRQEVRTELREKYKASDSHYYAYSDIEINSQKAYKDMMDNMLSSDDYVLVEYTGKKNYNKYNTIGEDVDITNFTAEDLSGYSIVDKSSVRTKTFVEQDSKRIAFRKVDWDNYQKELQRQLKKENNMFLKAYDNVSNTFKAMALASGRFVSNSAFGNFFESYMTSGVNLLNPKMIKNYMKFKAGEELEFNGYTTTEIMNAMELFGGMETDVSNMLKEDTLYKSVKGIADEVDTPLKKFLNKTKSVNPFSSDFGVYKFVMDRQGEIEEMSRFINVVTHLDNGEDLATAINRTTKALFDYSDLTNFETDVMKRIIPFYTFMRNNVPLQLENMANSPAKYQRMFKFYDDMEDLNSEKDQKLKPSYLDGALSIGNNKFLNLPNPVMELEDTLSSSGMLQSLNPLIKTPLELMLNKQFYSDSDISKYDKVGEKAKYAVEGVFPLFKQLGDVLSSASEGDYSKLANYMGVPIKTFDVDKAEQQTMYQYVEQLQNQYYELLEKYPELKEQSSSKNTKSSSPLSNLLKYR